MTLHQISSSRPLLARKGAAVPAAKKRSEEDAGPRVRPAAVHDGESEPHQFTLVATEPAPANGAAEAGGTGTPEPPPAASLLPFSLHRSHAGQTVRLPDEGTDAYVDPLVLAGSVSDGLADLSPDRAPPPESAGSAKTADAGGAPEAVSDAPLTAPDPQPEVRPGAAVASATLPAAPERGDSRVRWLAALLIAVVAVGAVAWWTLRGAPEPLDMPEAPPAEPVASAPAEAEAAPAAATPPDPAAAIAPSVDVVRIEPDGGTVIAGRAAPGSELIVLDRGTPLGTVKADAFGEWVFLPTEPLPAGEHEFGLVVKSVQGKVVVPAPTAPDAAEPSSSSPALPAGEAPAAPTPRTPPQERLQEIDPAVPLPPRKPVEVPDTVEGTGRTGSRTPQGAADFLVQLASVKTRDGALREWSKLKTRFPTLLAGAKLSLDEARLGAGGEVVRVRVGPFSARQEAADFCAAFEAARQDCLVLRTAGARADNGAGGAL